MSSDEGELLLRQLLRIDPSLRQLDITRLGGDSPVPKTVTVAAIIDVLVSYPRAERLVLRGLPFLLEVGAGGNPHRSILTGIGITSMDMAKIAPTLERLELRELDISDNRLGDEGAQCLAQTLPRCKHLRFLDLSSKSKRHLAR